MHDSWLTAVIATPGLTAIRDIGEARRVLLDDALAGAGLVSRFDGSIVDVGSGGGTPGIPLAASFPERSVTLLEAERQPANRKDGLVHSTELLHNMLRESGVAYDEFIFSV